MKTEKEINELTLNRIYESYKHLITDVEKTLIERGDRKAIIKGIGNILYDKKTEQEKETQGPGVDIEEIEFYFEKMGFKVSYILFYTKCMGINKCYCKKAFFNKSNCDTRSDMLISSWRY